MARMESRARPSRRRNRPRQGSIGVEGRRSKSCEPNLLLLTCEGYDAVVSRMMVPYDARRKISSGGGTIKSSLWGGEGHGLIDTPAYAIVGSTDPAGPTSVTNIIIGCRPFDDDDGSVGSLFDDAPSTLGTNEVKNDTPHDNDDDAAPTLNSAVPSKGLGQISSPLRHHRPLSKIQTQSMDKSKVSCLTMPRALCCAPPQLPAQSWGEMPQNRDSCYHSAHKELKRDGIEEDSKIMVSSVDYATASSSIVASGPKLGDEIEIYSRASSDQPMSEVTLPNSIPPMLAQALKRYHALLRAEQRKTVKSRLPPPPHPIFNGSGSVDQQAEVQRRNAVEQQQKAAVPPPPPRRPGSPRGQHQQATKKLATPNETIAGVSTMLPTTIEFALPVKQARGGAPPSLMDETMTHENMKQPSRAPPLSPESIKQSMDEIIMKESRHMFPTTIQFTLPVKQARGGTRHD
ncbi:hypothetical protein ACHAXA_006446 [Cyclostephanos tholiformis]|uniref:Uncharacterized protein n=1 Tax=Cyclostephanos tholiformis TaxID=382380 RepID=A0ABD3SEY3_9STRA